MKRLIYAIIAVFAIILASCSNDEIKVDTVNTIRYSNLSLNISTVSAYEKYGLTDFQTYLGSNSSCYIGVTSLLYDSNGVLVDSVCSYTRTFNSITQQYEKLTDGKYTVVTFETFVDSDNKFQSNNWELKDAGNLSTLQIHNKQYNVVSWQYSMGACTNTIDIAGDQQVNLSPNPIGVLLDFGHENFDKSDCFWLGFELRNTASGYLLNPTLSAAERYVYDDGYNKDHRWSARGEFYNGNRTNIGSSSNEKFYMMESGNIQYCFGPSNNIDEEWVVHFTAYPNENSYFDFKNGEYYKLFCYYTGYSTPVETFIGSNTEFTSWYTKMKSDVANVKLMEEPCLEWGASVEDIKKFMSDYSALDNGAVDTLENSYRISFDGKYKEYQIDYYFRSPTGGLELVNVFFRQSAVSDSEIISYLSGKGFTYSKTENDDLFYYSSQKQTEVCITTSASGDYRLLQFRYKSDVLFREPYLKWGASVADVKSYMSGYRLFNDTPEKNGDHYGLFFDQRDRELGTDYYFTSSTTGLLYLNIFFDPESVGEDEIVKKLTGDGFQFVVEEDNVNYYLDEQRKTVAAFAQNGQGYWYVQYYAYNANSRARFKESNLDRSVTLRYSNNSTKKRKNMPSLNRIEQWKPVNVLKCN